MKNLQVTLLSLLLLFGSSMAQEKLSMSLTEAKAYASENSYAVKGSQYDAEVAKRTVKETLAIGLPQVNGSLDYNNYIDIPTQVAPADAFGIPLYLTQFLVDVSEETGVAINAPELDPNTVSEFQFGASQTMTAGVSVSQLLFDGSYFVGLQAARAYEAAMSVNIEMTQRDVRTKVAEAYHTAIISRENAEILTESYAVLESLRRDTQGLFDAGFAEEQDLDQIDLTLADLSNQIQYAKNQEAITLDLLKFQMGLSLNVQLELTDDVESLISQGVNDLVNVPFSAESTMEYDIYNRQLELQKLNAKNEKAKGLPSIGAFYNYQRNAQRDEFNFLDGEGKWYPIQLWGVSLSMPIFTSFGGTHRVEKAKVEVERAKTQLEQTKHATALAYSTAKTEYSFALQNLDNMKRSVSLAEKIFNTTQIKYGQGMATSFDLTQKQNQMLTAQGNYIGSLLKLLNAQAQLNKSLNNI